MILKKSSKNSLLLSVGVLAAFHIYIIMRPTEWPIFNTYYPIYLISILTIFAGYRELIPVFSNKYFVYILVTCFGLSILSLTNLSIYDYFDRRLLLTWAAWLVVLSSTIILRRSCHNLSLNLARLGKLLLLVQLVISLLQVFEPHLFSFLWPSTENRGLDSHLRVSGTISNPIVFSFFVCYLVMLVISEKGPVKEFKWVFLGCLLILLSGSRSLILSYPILIGAWFYLEGDKKFIHRLVNAIVFSVLTFLITFTVLFLVRDVLVYSAELLTASDSLISNSGAESTPALRTFSYRAQYWNMAFIEFFSRNLQTTLLGYPGPYTASAHQDYLFMLTRYGFIGALLYISLFMVLLSLAYRNRQYFEGKLFYLTCLLSLTVGAANTVGVEMKMGILTAMTAGFLIAKVSKEKEPSETVKETSVAQALA